MPNWCYNKVILHNVDAAKMTAFKKYLDGGGPIAKYFLPIPQEEEWNWYEWCVAHWGTKWDFEPLAWSSIDNQIEINFESAWSPPIALYNLLVSEGWSVEAKYFESGEGYIGQYIDGSDDCYEYDISDIDSIKKIPEDLIVFGNLREEHEYWKEHTYTDGGF